MKAILCHRWGEPDDLVLAEQPPPMMNAGDVRLRVHACGVNYADVVMVAGQYQERPSFPFSPGMEVAGKVIEVGEAVNHVSPGDRVLAISSFGGYAEEAVMPAAVTFPLPEGMDYMTGAAITITYGTAHIALAHRGRLQPGELLLVHGAAGGVGLAAVEVGKLLGATVIATASTTEKLALAESHGADFLVNYRTEDFRARVKQISGGMGADVIFDPVGGDVFDRSVRCINWEGRLLIIGFASGRIPTLPANLALVKNFSAVGVFWGAYLRRDPAIFLDSLHSIMGWYHDGRLHPHISRTFPLEKASEALNMLRERRSTGKLVLAVGGDAPSDQPA